MSVWDRHICLYSSRSRQDGYKGDVIDDVRLDYDELKYIAGRWSTQSRACVAWPKRSKHYKVFKSADELLTAGFTPVAGIAATFYSWRDYVGLSLKPPNPGKLPMETWFDFWTTWTQLQGSGIVRPRLAEPEQKTATLWLRGWRKAILSRTVRSERYGICRRTRRKMRSDCWN